MSRQVAVHPNSMAARKWRRTSWTSHVDERDARGPTGRAARRPHVGRLFAAAHAARKRGEHERAAALVRQAMRASTTSITCG